MRQEIDNILLLSNLLRPAISLSPAGSSEVVSEALVKYAVERQRVGPLLHSACQHQQHLKFAGQARSLLRESFEANVLNGLRQKATERKMSELLSAHGLDFSFLKGLGLSAQLYPDPAVRQSSDVDILVPADQSGLAIKLLNTEGFDHIPYTYRRRRLLPAIRQKQDMEIFKDLIFRHPDFDVPVELHKRLFQFEPKGLTEEFGRSIRFEMVPTISNAHYCLYLILHGAVCLWKRMKWLADLSLLVRNMPHDLRCEVMSIARKFGCEIAVSSSLLFAERIFPGSLDENWKSLTATFEDHPHSHKLEGLFLDMMASERIRHPSLPLKAYLTSSVADLIFVGKIDLMPNMIRRYLASLSLRI